MISEEEYRQKVREWIEKNKAYAPIVSDEGTAEDYEKLRQWQRRLYEAGFLGITWPKEYGGQGLDPIYEVVAYEEFLKAGVPYRVGLGIGIPVVGPALLKHGTEEQKRKYLRRILTAEDIWCQGFSEPGAGSDLASIKTKAEDKGDYFLVNGQKIWSSYAHVADYMILLARTGEDRYKGLTMMIVDMKQPGIKVSPIRQITGRSEFNSVYFTDVKVPKENVIGSVGDGWRVAMTSVNNERLLIGLPMLFSAKLALQRLSDVSEELVDDLNGLEAYYKRLVNKLRKGEDIDAEGAVIKLVASELLQKIYEIAVTRYDLETIMKEKWYMGMLSSRGLTIAGATSEILRNLIGERLLKLPK